MRTDALRRPRLTRCSTVTASARNATQAPPTSGALGSQTPRYFSSPSDQTQGGAPAPTAIRKPTAVELEEMIRTVQMALMARGYDILGINGKLDAVTKMALKQYQEDSGYPVSGRMDARTLARLGIVGQ